MFDRYKPSTQLNQHMGLIYIPDKPTKSLENNKLVGNMYNRTLADLIFDLKYNYSMVSITKIKSYSLIGTLIDNSIITVFWENVREDTMHRIQITKITINANSTTEGDEDNETVYPCKPCSVQ